MDREIQQRLQWVKMYENVVMQASYVDAVVFPDQHYESGLSDISNVESLVWKARADALIHLQIPNSLMS